MWSSGWPFLVIHQRFHFLFIIKQNRYQRLYHMLFSELLVCFMCYSVAILFWHVFRIWRDCKFARQGRQTITNQKEKQNAVMILIARYVSSYSMNLWQRLVDILFVDRVYFSQWIEVGVLLFSYFNCACLTCTDNPSLPHFFLDLWYWS